MSRYRLSPRAKRDLDGIWAYSESIWGKRQAERYIRLLSGAVEAIATDPRKGRACDDIRPGYLKYPVGSHVVFYRLTGSEVEIVRILHGRMDFEQHL